MKASACFSIAGTVGHANGRGSKRLHRAGRCHTPLPLVAIALAGAPAAKAQVRRKKVRGSWKVNQCFPFVFPRFLGWANLFA